VISVVLPVYFILFFCWKCYIFLWHFVLFSQGFETIRRLCLRSSATLLEYIAVSLHLNVHVHIYTFLFILYKVLTNLFYCLFFYK